MPLSVAPPPLPRVPRPLAASAMQMSAEQPQTRQAVLKQGQPLNRSLYNSVRGTQICA